MKINEAGFLTDVRFVGNKKQQPITRNELTLALDGDKQVS
jgi:hypothetical protein